MFRGDYGFLSSMGGPKYFYKLDMPRETEYRDGQGRIQRQHNRGTYFQFQPFQGGRLDEQQHFIPEHVPCPALKGANIQRPGYAAGAMCVTSESERTGVAEGEILRYFMEEPHMKRKVSHEYVLVDKMGNPVPWDYEEHRPADKPKSVTGRGAPLPSRASSGELDPAIRQDGDRFWCELCQKQGMWRGRRGHENSREHRANRESVAA